MGKINQKQNGNGVTRGSGRSYLCLEERIEKKRKEKKRGATGEKGERRKKKERKESFQYFRSFGLLFLHAEALLTWTVWMSFVKSCCISQGRGYSVAPRTWRGNTSWTWRLVARSTVRLSYFFYLLNMKSQHFYQFLKIIFKYIWDWTDGPEFISLK